MREDDDRFEAYLRGFSAPAASADLLARAAARRRIRVRRRRFVWALGAAAACLAVLFAVQRPRPEVVQPPVVNVQPEQASPRNPASHHAMSLAYARGGAAALDAHLDRAERQLLPVDLREPL